MGTSSTRQEFRVTTHPTQSPGPSQRNPSSSPSVETPGRQTQPRDELWLRLTCALPRPAWAAAALRTVALSSFVDDTVTSSTSESSALSKKRFTLQGLATLKGQKGKRRSPGIVPDMPLAGGVSVIHVCGARARGRSREGHLIPRAATPKHFSAESLFALTLVCLLDVQPKVSGGGGAGTGRGRGGGFCLKRWM